LTPEAALQTQLESDKASFNLGAVDTTSMNRIVSPQIGFVPGVGGAYNGVIESASEPVNDAILAASNGRLTVYMSFAVGTAHDNTANAARALAADLIVDSFTWNS
jgi:hypothetical protein